MNASPGIDPLPASRRHRLLTRWPVGVVRLKVPICDRRRRGDCGTGRVSFRAAGRRGRPRASIGSERSTGGRSGSGRVQVALRDRREDVGDLAWATGRSRCWPRCWSRRRKPSSQKCLADRPLAGSGVAACRRQFFPVECRAVQQQPDAVQNIAADDPNLRLDLEESTTECFVEEDESGEQPPTRWSCRRVPPVDTARNRAPSRRRCDRPCEIASDPGNAFKTHLPMVLIVVPYWRRIGSRPRVEKPQCSLSPAFRRIGTMDRKSSSVNDAPS